MSDLSESLILMSNGSLGVIFKVIGACILILGVLIIFYRMRFIVPHGNVVLIEKFGKFHSVLDPGLHFVLPFAFSAKFVQWSYTEELSPNESSYSRSSTSTQLYNSCLIPTHERCFDPPAIKVITKDNMSLDINVVLFYRIVDPVKAVYNVQDLFQSLEQLTYTHISTACTSVDMEDVIQQRAVLVKKTFEGFRSAEEDWGLAITKFDVQSISIPHDILKRKTALRSEKIQKEIEQERMMRDQERRTLEVETERKIVLTKLETRVQQEKKEADLQIYKMIKEAEARAEMARIATEKELHYIRELTAIDRDLARDVILHEKKNESLRLLAQSSAKNEGSLMIIPYESAEYFGFQGAGGMRRREHVER